MIIKNDGVSFIEGANRLDKDRCCISIFDKYVEVK